MTFTEVGSGNNIKKNMLDENDAFIFDTGAEVYLFIV
jgi:hypothetical protein